MGRAFALKGIAAALVGLELWLVDGPLAGGLALLTVAMLVVLFVWAIVSPRAQVLLPTAWRLRGATVAFTFDDGPDPVYTPRVLDVLARHGARATFFVVGARAAAHPDLVRRIEAEGHLVGTHTQHHSHLFHFGSAASMRRDIEAGLDTVERIVGHRPRLFRPPQGLRTPLLRDALQALPSLVCVTWTERGLDAMGRPSSRIVARLERALAPGAILTLHDGAGLGGTLDRAPTVEALEVLLGRAKALGLSCVTLAELESR
jgi:peptidoglycan/xylan/chitin deacetylase (PgdA/CDA1 family)